MPTVPFVVLLCLAEVVGMLGFASFAALLPTFLAQWGLSNTEAGWINGIFSAGYMAAVLVLAAITDRVAARNVYVFSSALSALAAFGFAALAEGFWSALAFRALAGIGLAGTYVPGLKALSDRVAGPLQSRAVAFYTSSFSVGASVSLLATGAAGAAFGWSGAFALAGVGPLAAAALVWALLPGDRPRHVAQHSLLDFRPVLRNRPAMGYVLAYACHMWELFGVRNWLVAFLAFCAVLAPSDSPLMRPTVVAAVVSLAGLIAGVAGNELAQLPRLGRFGGARFLAMAMLVGAASSCLFALSAGLPMPAVAALAFVYCFFNSWDSAVITAGVVVQADPRLRGATMALQSGLGFLAAAVSPLVFGMVLDGAGGNRSPGAWLLAFMSLALGVALGPLVLRWAGLLRAPGGAPRSAA
jgi:predicted MFS family arabinose efflux permease